MRKTPTLPTLEEFENKKTVTKKGKKKNQVVIGQQHYVNQITGEVEEFTVIKKNVNKDFNFHKIWLEDLLSILDSMGNRKITILTYLLKIMRNDDNTLMFTMRSLSEDTGVSLQTCQTTINELIESNVIKRDKRIKQLYTFNPDLLVKGDSNKRNRLLIEYNFEDEKNDIQNGNKNKKQLPNFEELKKEKSSDVLDVEYIEKNEL